MLVNLNDLLPDAAASDYSVPCFNVFGYEDARAVVEAAEEVGKAVILACNKDVVDFYGVETAAAMFLNLAHNSSVPVCLHLDHTYEEDIVYRALKAGFSSVMFDGSQLTLEENIARTKKVVDVAHALVHRLRVRLVRYLMKKDVTISSLSIPSQKTLRALQRKAALIVWPFQSVIFTV